MLLLLLALTSADTSLTLRIPVAPAESLSVTIVGEGPPVVLIPGLFGTSYAFRHVMALLDTAGYRAVGVEPLGMGSSSRPKDADYSLTAQADRVAAVLDSLGIEQAVLVGHSLGASIALRLAYRHPESARGIVSLEGGPGETATTKGFRFWMRFAPVIRMLDTRRVMQGLIYRDLKKMPFDESWVDQSVVQAYTMGMAQDPRGTISEYRAMGRAEEPELLRDYLATIECPVVLLVGDTKHDGGPPKEQITLLVDRLPSFAIDTVAQFGFFIQEVFLQSTATEEAMANTSAPITESLKFTDMIMNLVTSDLTDDVATRRSRDDDGASIAWIIGHLCHYDYEITKLLGGDAESPFAEMFA